MTVLSHTYFSYFKVDVNQPLTTSIIHKHNRPVFMSIHLAFLHLSSLPNSSSPLISFIPTPIFPFSQHSLSQHLPSTLSSQLLPPSHLHFTSNTPPPLSPPPRQHLHPWVPLQYFSTPLSLNHETGCLLV